MIEEGKTGFLVAPGDWKDLAGKISFLLRNEDLQREMGRKAREKAKALYHPATIASKTLEVYQEILPSE